MNTFRGCAVMALVLALSGCAAAKGDFAKYKGHGKEGFQTMSVRTPGTEGARCFLQTKRATYQIVTPASIEVERSNAPMTVSCFKGEHFRGEAYVAAKKVSEQGKSEAYIYPQSVAISMQLYNKSMDRNVRVF